MNVTARQISLFPFIHNATSVYDHPTLDHNCYQTHTAFVNREISPSPLLASTRHRPQREFGGKPPAPADGKKFICLDKIFNFTPGKCLIFSFGVNNEWSFEDEMEKFGCKVYAFDPTMGKEDHQRSPNIKFYATGIAHYKGTKRIGMGNNWSEKKVDRFENLVRQAGEEGREIDYVKLDVELSEIDFLQDMLFNSPHVLAKIKQIGMEVHDGPFRDGISETISVLNA
ncbi:hypothetical protein E2C01_025032 [Portunus trituberculatus]|uniref:Methyltransferase domain-containing protein n=1 Tax=Portunus trituberculatus TaxID=210409 RepID=A0A5B7EEC4_PORTR|nr:hypothetical protein [Portunus trituberculatus]